MKLSIFNASITALFGLALSIYSLDLQGSIRSDLKYNITTETNFVPVNSRPIVLDSVIRPSMGIKIEELYMSNVNSLKMSGDSIKLEPSQSLYERRKERGIVAWDNLIPKYSKLQIAGGMGVFSLGLGWDYGKKKQWETDLLFGYLPKFSGSRSSITMTLKQNYIPWRVRLSNTFNFEPFTTGLYMNYLFAQNFWTREPDKYGGPYYRFATNLRFSVFVGQRLTMKLRSKYALHKSLSIFYELSSNDLYLISLFINQKTLRLHDILVLSFGLKFHFR